MSNGYYQQQLVHHNASLIQNKYALNITLKLRAEEVANTDNLAKILGSKTRIYEEINFVICQSCFWCASCLSSRILITMEAGDISASLAKCPSCIEGNIESIPIESIPIAQNENYRFDYNAKRGVTVEFFR